MRIVHFCKFLESYSVRVSEIDDIIKLNKSKSFIKLCVIKDVTTGTILSSEFLCKNSSKYSLNTFKKLVWLTIGHRLSKHANK